MNGNHTKTSLENSSRGNTDGHDQVSGRIHPRLPPHMTLICTSMLTLPDDLRRYGPTGCPGEVCSELRVDDDGTGVLSARVRGMGTKDEPIFNM
jgi:hypothetical protein